MPLSIISQDPKCKVPLSKLVVASPPLPAASPTPDVDCVACAGRERTSGHYKHIFVDDARIGNKGSILEYKMVASYLSSSCHLLGFQHYPSSSSSTINIVHLLIT